MQELWFLHSARRLILIDIFMKFHKDSLNGFQVIVRTRLRQDFVVEKVPRETRIVRGSDYSPAKALSEDKAIQRHNSV